MRLRRLQLLKLTAVGLAVTMFAASLAYNSATRGGATAAAAPVAQEVDEGLPADPRVESMEAEPLGPETVDSAAGNARLTVRYAADANVGPVVKTVIDDRDVLLRDDGQGGDVTAGDGTHSAIIFLDFEALAANQDEIAAINAGPEPTPEPEATAEPAEPTTTADALEADNGGADSLASTTSTAPTDERLASDTSVLVPDFDASRDRVGLQEFEKVDFRAAAPGRPVRLFPIATHRRVDPARSLVITNIRVVEDPTRTFNPCTNVGTPMGAWTFGKLMTEMANQPRTGIHPSTFVRQWLDKWLNDQTTANGWTAEKRLQMKALVIDPWVAASGGPHMPLNLAKAPMRLLAIVNRVDLRSNSAYGGGSAGEGRFVYGVMDMRPGSKTIDPYTGQPVPACAPTQFTIIIEYGIDRRGCGIRDWGRQWYNLRNFVLGSAAYNAALQRITDQFTLRNVAPHKPNGSALNQLRTNEIALANAPPDDTWQMREFTLAQPNSHLNETNVALTPDESRRNTDLTARYVNANTPSILTQTHVVPFFFLGQKFRGNESNVPFMAFWNNGPTIPIFNRQARHLFSLNTCSACHAGETNTVFTHIKPAAFGTPAGLSGFMTGINVPDPADGAPTRTFNEFRRRAIDLDRLVHSPCFFDIRRHFLAPVH
jgi:hypothetical protein